MPRNVRAEANQKSVVCGELQTPGAEPFAVEAKETKDCAMDRGDMGARFMCCGIDCRRGEGVRNV